ncbi:hypothetical protein BX616_007117 [Lobosporangium transversale]|uniref:F-box domain-containing protein n=1 Tax=Lobosporangium transversale TaxID=64571 RepID=A0A1Y2H5R9_9FUNG|nr:hypothetical protein BCR41DRAFT_344467 [Lobosporangium transversale]KAF9915007.1 hypothetical protein BX616_007117 [Lobosporangium transversale]ORZ29043.1 hypothetical protein BCR41DRAFT_344467 [Lobosporangium transversale]|eukprot:XP_021886716.1 hypothetical protein BCR41DRAFT_344467 [Lobosporangium transversale]
MNDQGSTHHSNEGNDSVVTVKTSHRNAPLSLTDMPAEVIMQLTIHLSTRDFASFIQTNRVIYSITDSHYVWHQRFIKRFGQGLLEDYLKSHSRAAKGKDVSRQASNSSSRTSTRPSTPEQSTRVGNSDLPGTVYYDHLYHNHQDPAGRESESGSTDGGDDDDDDGDDGNEDSNSRGDQDGDDDVDKNAKELPSECRKVDLRKTNELSKRQLIELYKYYSRVVLPAEDLYICHLGDQYWKIVESSSSEFGKLAQLSSVWWMDVQGVFYGVPPGRYKVQWRVKVTSDAPIINSEFRAALFNRFEDKTAVDDRLETICFKPRNIQEFMDQTDSQISKKAHKRPFRRLFKERFTILELPGDLVIEGDFQNVFLQIRNFEGWKSGLFIDYVRLVDMNDPKWNKKLLSARSGNSSTEGSEEEVNDDGEEYYPSSSSSSILHQFQNGLGIVPDVRLNPLTYRPITISRTTSTQPTTASSSSTTGNQSDDEADVRLRGWYRLYAVLILYCLYFVDAIGIPSNLCHILCVVFTFLLF